MDGWTHKLPFYGTDFGPPHLPVSFSAGVPLVRHHHCFIVLHKGAGRTCFPPCCESQGHHTLPFALAGSAQHLVDPFHVLGVIGPFYETGERGAREGVGREGMKCGLCFKGFSSSFCCLSMPHCPSTAADRKNVRDGQQQQQQPGCVPWCRGPTPSLPPSLPSARGQNGV